MNQLRTEKKLGKHLDPCNFCSLLCPSLHEIFPCMSNFLEEIASLSHSIVFFYFSVLITENSFLISPCFLWNSAFKWLCLSFSPLPLASFLFSAICKASSDSHFAFLHFFFMEMVLISVSCTMSQTSVHSSSGTLSIRSNPLNLFLTSTV